MPAPASVAAAPASGAVDADASLPPAAAAASDPVEAASTGMDPPYPPDRSSAGMAGSDPP
ncbi:MAG TPA: hypothetical protein VF006_23510 [Longimicrobium sp.]